MVPPPMESDHKYYRSIVDNPKFKDDPSIKIPQVESLQTTMVRTLPYWENTIVPAIVAGKRVLVVTHGTTLRGLVKHIDGKACTVLKSQQFCLCIHYLVYILNYILYNSLTLLLQLSLCTGEIRI